MPQQRRRYIRRGGIYALADGCRVQRRYRVLQVHRPAVVGAAQRYDVLLGGRAERFSMHYHRPHAPVLQFHRIAQTARYAAASIADGGNHEIALGQFINNFRGGGR